MKKMILMTGILAVISIITIGCGLFTGSDETSGREDTQIPETGDTTEEDIDNALRALAEVLEEKNTVRLIPCK